MWRQVVPSRHETTGLVFCAGLADDVVMTLATCGATKYYVVGIQGFVWQRNGNTSIYISLFNIIILQTMFNNQENTLNYFQCIT